MFRQCVLHAPSVEDKIRITRFQGEEFKHFRLIEYTRGSYLPPAEANRVILEEEEGHKNFSEACVEEMSRDPETRAEIQRRFRKWFVASLRTFSRAGTPGNEYCVRVGLKTRDSGEVAAAYLDSIRPVMETCGLAFPARDEHRSTCRRRWTSAFRLALRDRRFVTRMTTRSTGPGRHAAREPSCRPNMSLLRH